MPGRRGKRCLRHPACITPAPYGARIPPRPWPRRWKLVFAGALTSGVAALIVLRIPDAAADVRAASAQVDGRRLPLLGAALAARTLSLGGSATAQRWLLAAVGTRLPRRAMFGLALASAGLSSLIPAGQLPLPPGSPAATAAAVRRALWGYGPWWPTGSPPPSPSWRCC